MAKYNLEPACWHLGDVDALGEQIEVLLNTMEEQSRSMLEHLARQSLNRVFVCRCLKHALKYFYINQSNKAQLVNMTLQARESCLISIFSGKVLVMRVKDTRYLLIGLFIIL